MRPAETVAIVGLGLMGGSLAGDLHARGVTVTGYDLSPEVLEDAIAAGIVARRLAADLGGVADATVVVLAVPVDRAGELLRRVALHLAPGAVVTDVGSVKHPIVRLAEELGIGDRFIGGHPLTGDHRSGWAAARPGLFSGARVFLCPTSESAPWALERLRALWSALGASPEVIDAAAHDMRMAWVSHLPQIASSALASTLAAAGLPPSELGPGGRDATRLAASSPEMWSAICQESPDAVSTAIGALEARLRGLRAALASGDAAAIRDFFTAGRDWSS